MEKVRIGVVGCGMISEIYMQNITHRFGNLQLEACADLNPEAAQRRAAQFGCRTESVEELMQDPRVDIVLNLTIPAAHAAVSRQALEAGKHVYTEKPFATDLLEGRQLLELARARGLYIGNAPDCFLGGGIQTVCKLIGEGAIGTPFAAQAFMISSGPERFHPNPQFLYEGGAGPLLDMGPYYISALVALFGPVQRVYSVGRRPVPERLITAPRSPMCGQKFRAQVDTYISGVLEFENGFTADLTVSFDGHYPYWEADMPYIRVYGTAGYLDLPDTNKYEGPVLIRDQKGERRQVPLAYGFTENCRGMGLSDMAHAIQNQQTDFRANGAFGLHVTEVLLAIQESARTHQPIEILSSCERPAPLPEGMPDDLYH